MYSKNDIKQLELQGVSIEAVETQLADFRRGFPPMNLVAAATPDKGIKQLSEDEEERYVSVFENALGSGLDAVKFVPASGAASRMFKSLFEFLEQAGQGQNPQTLIEKNGDLQQFFAQLEKFAFYKELSSLTDLGNPVDVVSKLLLPQGLNYGNKPKGQISFHKYNNNNCVRTPFEEHLVETASYCTGSNGQARVHFTVSPEHLEGFEKLLQTVVNEYQKRYGIHYDVSFSFQKKSTDTIAVTPDNELFRNSDGSLLFRPGGHGALLENLTDLDADLIFIKNIDNVVPDRLKADTKRYKKALAGMLITLRNKMHSYLEKLDKPETADDSKLLNTIDLFLRRELNIDFKSEFDSIAQRIEFYKKKLNRPTRICGMVKNEGEPGGGPFWAQNPDSTVSLQIVESAQIDLENLQQRELFDASTHFNPVDLICCTRNYKGQKFDLLQYRDPATGFISHKSKDGKPLKALELPGLWNGAMSNWNTIFVEVPAITFNPVKTINDLLRPEHQ